MNPRGRRVGESGSPRAARTAPALAGQTKPRPAATPPVSAAHAARRFLRIVLWAYLAFVVYGSLVPLHYVWVPWDEAWQRFQQAPFLNLGVESRADLVANLLLFLPLSFMMLAQTPAPRVGLARALAALLTALLCVALAVGIEFAQVFFPGRTVSQNDVLAEAAGALLGIGLYFGYGRPVLDWLSRWWLEQSTHRFSMLVLRGYLAAVLIYAVMPLDLTISPVELVHKLHAGRINLVPFAGLPGDPALAIYKLATDVLLWWPVGLLWRLNGAAPLRAARNGLLAAAVIELLQLFVYSRFSSVTDIITASLGSLAGAACVSRAWLRRDGVPEQGSATTRRMPWPSLWLAWSALALAVFWYPFEFDASSDFVRPRLAGWAGVPFATYYMGTEYHALTELLRKVLMFMPGGLLWAGVVGAGRPRARRLRIVCGVALTAGMAMLVEGGQILLPGKVSDLTDIVLEAGGGWIGLALGLQLGRAPQDMRVDTGPLPAVPAPSRLGLAAAEAAAVFALALILYGVGRLDAMPYNVRDLLPSGAAGAAAAAGVALVCWWLFATPLSMLARWQSRPERSMWLVPALPLLGLPAGIALWATTPTKSFLDIVGSPVLDWPGPIEPLLRYLALHGVLALAMIGAVWLVARLAWRRRFELLPRWAVALMVWAFPLHWVVVVEAATDNLTELMRDDGSALASVYLFAGALSLFTAASAFAAALMLAGRRSRLVVIGLLAWPAAAGWLWLGSQPLLLKYGKVFSAAQFLLSRSREHYASGTELVLRFVAATALFFAIVALLQAPRWRHLAQAWRDTPRR